MQTDSKKEAKRIGIAMILGLAIGLFLYKMNLSHYSEYIKPIGTIFIRLLKMVIIPLVFSSIYMAMTNLGTPDTLGSMGRKAMGYYFVTTAIAVFIGIVFVNLIQPGIGADLGTQGLDSLSATMTERVQGQKGLFQTILGVIIDAIPTNPFGSMAEGKVLPVIVFAILMGITALYNDEKALGLTRFMSSLEDITMALTNGIMRLAPIGIFALMLDVMAKSGFSALNSLWKYALTVTVGLICHGIVLLLIASYKSKKSPAFILKGMAAPLLTAFSTSSSAATLPITMTAVQENLGVEEETAQFVLPLGATVNMDGTALYESVAAIFIAQAYQIHLDIGQQVIIFMTASLAAIGAAAIPGAGLITMSIVLSAVGLPIEGIGLILAVDRILDMVRTTVNVFGDGVGTVVVDSMLRKERSKQSS